MFGKPSTKDLENKLRAVENDNYVKGLQFDSLKIKVAHLEAQVSQLRTRGAPVVQTVPWYVNPELIKANFNFDFSMSESAKTHEAIMRESRQKQIEALEAKNKDFMTSYAALGKELSLRNNEIDRLRSDLSKANKEWERMQICIRTLKDIINKDKPASAESQKITLDELLAKVLQL